MTQTQGHNAFAPPVVRILYFNLSVMVNPRHEMIYLFERNILTREKGIHYLTKMKISGPGVAGSRYSNSIIKIYL